METFCHVKRIYIHTTILLLHDNRFKGVILQLSGDMLNEYRCPLCCDHQDDSFVWDDLAETYVCLGCSHEINNGFDSQQQPTLDEYNCADTIERLLAFLGISYDEARRRHLELSRP